MLKVEPRTRNLMLNNQVAPAELLLLYKAGVAAGPADRRITRNGMQHDAVLKRTNAPFNITFDGVEYLSGLYPLSQAANPDAVRISERSLLQIQLQDVNWALRTEFLAQGASHLRIEVALALLDGSVGQNPNAASPVLETLPLFRGHSVSAQSELSQQGPVVNISFAGLLDKLSAERAVVVSQDSQYNKDPKDDSMKHADTSRSFQWSH